MTPLLLLGMISLLGGVVAILWVKDKDPEKISMTQVILLTAALLLILILLTMMIPGMEHIVFGGIGYVEPCMITPFGACG